MWEWEKIREYFLFKFPKSKILRIYISFSKARNLNLILYYLLGSNDPKYLNWKLSKLLTFFFFIFFPKLKKLNISAIYKANIFIFSVNLPMAFIYKLCKYFVSTPRRTLRTSQVRLKKFELHKISKKSYNFIQNGTFYLLYDIDKIDSLNFRHLFKCRKNIYS